MPRHPERDPEQAARELREKLNILSIPVPVDRVAKALGAEVRFSPLDNELSGMIFIRQGIPIIGVNILHHPNRQRFTIAHEIGHLELHKDLITSHVHVDKVFPVLMRNGHSAAGTDKIEIQANQFAAELLMPSEQLRSAINNRLIDIEDEKTVEELARKFKVSPKTMEFRMQRIASA